MDFSSTQISLDLAWQVGMTLVVIVSCFFSVRFGLNGARLQIIEVAERTKEIKADVKTLLVSDSEQNARLAGLEATQTAQDGWIRRVEKVADAPTRGQDR